MRRPTVPVIGQQLWKALVDAVLSLTLCCCCRFSKWSVYSHEVLNLSRSNAAILILFSLCVASGGAVGSFTRWNSTPHKAESPVRERVAVLFSGQPRPIMGTTHESWHAVLNPALYDVEFFGHLWKSPGHEKSVEDIFTDAYSPVAAIFEDLIPESILLHDRNYTNTYGPDMPYRFMSMFTSMKRVVELFEGYQARTAKKYDWIIRARTDSVVLSFPSLKRVERGFLYFEDMVPLGGGIITLDHDEWMRDEIIIMSGNDSCKGCASTCMRILDNVHELYGKGIPLNDEHMLFAHLKHSRLLPNCRRLPPDALRVQTTRDNGLSPQGATKPSLPLYPNERGYAFSGYMGT